MKWFRPLAIIISILLVTILALGFIAPKDYYIRKEVVVDAPRNLVFKKVNSLQAMQQWSPMNYLDPEAVFEFSGTEGTVGSKMEWNGNKDIGAGQQEMVLVMPVKRVETYIRFSEPWEAVSESNFSLLETEAGTRVIWEFNGKNPFPFNIMMLFYNVEKFLGPDFQRGLDSMKVEAESEYLNEKYRGYTIEKSEMDERSYLAILDTISTDSINMFIEQRFQLLDSILSFDNIEIGGPRSALFYEWIELSNNSVAAVAYEVAREAESENLYEVVLPSSDILLIDHYGGKGGTTQAHLAMDAYMADNDLENIPPVIEEYITDKLAESDSSKWHTRVIYKVKTKEEEKTE